MSTRIDPTVFHRMLRERCISGEKLRHTLGLSPATLAKLNRGDLISDSVFRRVVLGLQQHAVVPIAQELANSGAGQDEDAREETA